MNIENIVLYQGKSDKYWKKNHSNTLFLDGNLQWLKQVEHRCKTILQVP